MAATACRPSRWTSARAPRPAPRRARGNPAPPPRAMGGPRFERAIARKAWPRTAGRGDRLRQGRFLPAEPDAARLSVGLRLPGLDLLLRHRRAAQPSRMVRGLSAGRTPGRLRPDARRTLR